MGLKFTNKLYTDVRQPEIDAIRATGQDPEPGIWDKVKYGGTEMLNDIFNDHRYDIDQYTNPSEFRDQAFQAAKDQALRDYQLKQSGVAGPFNDPSPWLNLKSGDYNK